MVSSSIFYITFKSFITSLKGQTLKKLYTAQLNRSSAVLNFFLKHSYSCYFVVIFRSFQGLSWRLSHCIRVKYIGSHLKHSQAVSWVLFSLSILHFLLVLFLATKTQSSPSRVQKGKGKQDPDESTNSCMFKLQKRSLQLIFYSRLFHLQL